MSCVFLDAHWGSRWESYFDWLVFCPLIWTKRLTTGIYSFTTKLLINRTPSLSPTENSKIAIELLLESNFKSLVPAVELLLLYTFHPAKSRSLTWHQSAMHPNMCLCLLKKFYVSERKDETGWDWRSKVFGTRRASSWEMGMIERVTSHPVLAFFHVYNQRYLSVLESRRSGPAGKKVLPGDTGRLSITFIRPDGFRFDSRIEISCHLGGGMHLREFHWCLEREIESFYGLRCSFVIPLG